MPIFLIVQEFNHFDRFPTGHFFNNYVDQGNILEVLYMLVLNHERIKKNNQKG